MFLFLSFAICVEAQGKGKLIIEGVTYDVDTLSQRKVGPDSYYTALRFYTAMKQIRAFILEVDAQNPYIKFETVQGKDSLITCEKTSEMAMRKSKEGAVYLGGTNADFFVTVGDVGYPIHGCVIDNQIGRTPYSSAPSMVFTNDNTPILDNIVFTGSTCKFGNSTMTINDMNVKRGENQLILYNTLNGNYTHTNTVGTEVLVALSTDTKWDVNKNLKAKIVAKEQGKGNMHILPNHAVLSGHGTSASLLNELNIGDEVELYLGIQFTDSFGTPTVAAMVGGDRLILKNGEVTDNDWAELHPRTGIGYSQDSGTVYFCVVDGRSSSSAGVRTKELGEIMKSAGASTAINLDGGGSSALYVKDFGIMNTPSDGTERAVCNGIYAVDTAPTDNNITEIRSSIYTINLPKYGVYTPLFYGYNQYGTLIDTDVKGVTLSCDQNMGEIDGNTFIASGTENGALVADYKGVKTKINIILSSDAVPSLRLDSVLVDKYHPYSVELLAPAGDMMMPVLPAALTWAVDDPNICSIAKGVITGVSNGKTSIHGKLGDITLTQKVTVEIPVEESISVDKQARLDIWTLKGTSNISNLALSSPVIPTNLTYSFAAGRSPYVQLLKDLSLYSLPSSLKIVLNTGTSVVSSIIIGVKANNAKLFTPFQYKTIPVGADYTLELRLKDLVSDASDRASYPVFIDGLKLMLDGTHPAGPSSISIKEFSMEYDYITVSINNPELVSRLRVYPNPVINGEAYLSFNRESSVNLRMELYTQSGSLVCVSDLGNVRGEVKLPLKKMASGIYFVRIIDGDKTETVKVILK